MAASAPSIVIVALATFQLVYAEAPERGKNLLLDPGFEEGSHWAPVGEGYALDGGTFHTGDRSLRLEGHGPDSAAGAKQVVTLDPPLLHPSGCQAGAAPKAPPSARTTTCT